MGCRQAVRHQTLTLAFVGSNPAIPAKSDPLAQAVEQLPFKQWVRGSSPRRVTKKPNTLLGIGFFAVWGLEHSNATVRGTVARRVGARRHLNPRPFPDADANESPAGHQKTQCPFGYWVFCRLDLEKQNAARSIHKYCRISMANCSSRLISRLVMSLETSSAALY